MVFPVLSVFDCYRKRILRFCCQNNAARFTSTVIRENEPRKRNIYTWRKAPDMDDSRKRFEDAMISASEKGGWHPLRFERCPDGTYMETVTQAAYRGFLAAEAAAREQVPFAWAREWEGDVSDLGNMIVAFDESEKDDSPNWFPLYAAPVAQHGEQVKATPQDTGEAHPPCTGATSPVGVAPAQDAVAVPRSILKELRLSHTECEDSWFSCPLSTDGCCDDRQPEGVCNCGADARNSIIDELLAAPAAEKKGGA